jgi:NAD(P)H-dependent FMN reductase
LTKIQVIMGSTRHGRFSERVAAWVVEYLAAYGRFEVELVDAMKERGLLPLQWRLPA